MVGISETEQIKAGGQGVVDGRQVDIYAVVVIEGTVPAFVYCSNPFLWSLYKANQLDKKTSGIQRQNLKTQKKK